MHSAQLASLQPGYKPDYSQPPPFFNRTRGEPRSAILDQTRHCVLELTSPVRPSCLQFRPTYALSIYSADPSRDDMRFNQTGGICSLPSAKRAKTIHLSTHHLDRTCGFERREPAPVIPSPPAHARTVKNINEGTHQGWCRLPQAPRGA